MDGDAARIMDLWREYEAAGSRKERREAHGRAAACMREVVSRRFGNELTKARPWALGEGIPQRVFYDLLF